MTTTTNVILPYLDVTGLDNGALTSANESVRWRAVDRLAADYDVTIPPGWRGGPLQAWCYLVLAVNGIDRDDDDPKPLVSYGIDLGFAASDVRSFVWFLA